MNKLAIAVQVELIKLRRTLAFWMMLFAPLAVAGLTLLYSITRLDSDSSGAGDDAWSVLTGYTLGLWVVLMLPLFVALESALMAQLEHSQKMWKHLFSLPAPRWTVYLAKLFVTISIVGVSMTILMAGILLSGELLQILSIRPDFQWVAPNPSWAIAIRTAVLVFILSWGMIALQTYISMRWSSFTVALGIGSLGSIMTVIFVRSVTLSQVIPWLLPINALAPYIKQPTNLGIPLLVSLSGTLMFTLLGIWNLNTKDII
jgi:ABC-2 type transport system permease protein